MERALAHVEYVHDINKIEGADAIELVHVLGWTLIAKIGEFKEGDKCVYIEIDSQVDTTMPCFEFLASKGGRIKTLKLNKFGVVSQGIAMPLSSFGWDPNKYKEGQDVTKELKIHKYENPEEKRLAKEGRDLRVDRVSSRYKKFMKTNLAKFIMKHKTLRKIFLSIFGGKRIKPKAWPDFISKTDEIRIENVPFRLEDKSPLEVTEKLDGTSTTFFIKKKTKDKYEFGVCSRNVRQLDRDQACYHDYNIYWAMADKYKVEVALNKLAEKYSYPEYIVLQGESIGAVQGNPYKLKEDDFYAFNLIINGKKIDSVKGKEIIADYGIKWVPILDTNFICPDTMEEMKKLATAKSVINPSVLREGCVYRNAENTISFKNVSNEYLLKHNQ